MRTGRYRSLPLRQAGACHLPLAGEDCDRACTFEFRQVKSSSFAAFDIFLQHIGAKESALLLPFPLWTAT